MNIRSIFIILITVLVFSFLQFSTGAIGDPDTFYHLKMAGLVRDSGLVRDFSWMYFTTWNGGFIDHHLLFHAFLIPFTFFNSFVGMKIATVISGTAFVFIFYLLLKKLEIKLPWFWVLLLLFGSSPFLFRLNLGRAQNLSLLFLFLAVYLLLRKINFKINLYQNWKLKIGNWKLLFIVSFFYVWLYGGFVTILIVVGIFNLIELFYTKKVKSFKPFFVSFLGVAAGLVINPYFPKNLDFLKIQMFQIPFADSTVEKGGEWSSVLSDWPGFLGNNFLVLFLFATAILFIIYDILKSKSFSSDGRQSIVKYQLLATALFFLLLTFKSQRFIEYFIPLAVLFAASGLNSLWVRDYLKTERLIFKIPISKKIIKFFTINSLLAIILVVFAVNITSAYVWVRGGWPPNDDYREAAWWLQQNTPKDSIVFNIDWDDFPQLFYNNTHNNYIVGLDPTFMYAYDQELYWLWFHITKEWDICPIGRCDEKISTPVTDIIKNRFDSNYIFLDKSSVTTGIETKLKNDGNLKKVFEKNDIVIYEL